MCQMFYRLCCCCFGFGQPTSTKLLKKDQQYYTVRKISSFGRAISNDDDDGINNIPDQNFVVINKNSATWSSRPTLVQPSIHYDNGDSSRSVSQHTSPIGKRKGNWSKALTKMTKREMKKEHLQSFQSLANVSMMMLPTITVVNSSSSPSSLGNLQTEDAGADTLDRHNNSGANLKKFDDSKYLSIGKNSNSWLKSQSMLDVNSISDNESERIQQRRKTSPKFGLDVSSMSKSAEAINKVWKSMEDFPNGTAFVDLPMGTVHFTATYNKLNKKLLVHIRKIEGLAPKGEDRHKYNYILKLSVLPNEKHVKYSKTIQAHALNIDEQFTFTIRDISTKVLRISIYPASNQGKYDAVGHALFYVVDTLSNFNEAHIMKLYKQSLPDVEPGSIRATLKYEKSVEMLHVRIHEVYNLQKFSGKCKLYIKILQYFGGKKVRELYSPAVAAKSEVTFNFNANLKVENKSVGNTYVVINVKIKGFLKKSPAGGKLILGPFLYAEYGQKLTPWGRIFILREQVSHTFRMYL